MDSILNLLYLVGGFAICLVLETTTGFQTFNKKRREEATELNNIREEYYGE